MPNTATARGQLARRRRTAARSREGSCAARRASGPAGRSRPLRRARRWRSVHEARHETPPGPQIGWGNAEDHNRGWFPHDYARDTNRKVPVGTVLTGEAEARAEAIVVSGEMLKDLGGAFWNHGEWQVRVEHETGNKVCALTFRLTSSTSKEVALA